MSRITGERTILQYGCEGRRLEFLGKFAIDVEFYFLGIYRVAPIMDGRLVSRRRCRRKIVICRNQPYFPLHAA
jgi:hypothetical protein